MDSGTRAVILIGFTFLVCLGSGVHAAHAQQIRIEALFPGQLPRGQTTVINVAVPSRDAIQAVDISPSPGVKVAGIKRAESAQGALTWSEITIDVAADAAAGDRTLVLQLPTGRTAPLPIAVPTHVPSLADLRLLSASSTRATLDLQVAASDALGDLGELPYVWFTLGCGREPLVGVVRGRITPQGGGGTLVRASVPTPRTPAGAKCDLQVRLTDSAGIESNTLKATVAFTN